MRFTLEQVSKLPKSLQDQVVKELYGSESCKKNTPVFLTDAVPDSIDRKVSRPEPKQTVRDGTLAAAQGKADHPRRLLVRITSYRRFALDPDNIAGGCKYLLDCCRYSGLIPDDRPQDIKFEVEQVIVKGKENERTEILIDQLPICLGT